MQPFIRFYNGLCGFYLLKLTQSIIEPIYSCFQMSAIDSRKDINRNIKYNNANGYLLNANAKYDNANAYLVKWND
jgi:hypothetical protein